MATKHTIRANDSKSSNRKFVELDAKIAELNEEILTLRQKLFQQREEIHSLRNSRVLGKIIRVRDLIGNPSTVPSRSVNKARRTLAKFVPDSIRLPLMKSLRHLRDTTKQKANQRHNELISTIVVDNVVWKKNTPLVSVVIPYYNRVDTIDDTLHSLTGQTFRDFEVIIVDDGSTDKASVLKLNSIEKSSFKATIVSQNNQGVASARNNGIKRAKGKYIVCLDSDDMLEPTFLEKAATVLETNPEVSIASSYMSVFGVTNKEFRHADFDPLILYKDNMIITAAMFKKEAWEVTGGYKSKIGYEDWEFWINLIEHGYWATTIPESLFRYRTSMQSRYIEDKDAHWNNLRLIRSFHPNYKKRVRELTKERRLVHQVISPKTAFVNLSDKIHTKVTARGNILIAIPWMTFGGAETLIYNFCREIKNDYDITFVTGLKSDNEWEYKFAEITQDIYHLPNLFKTDQLYLDYISHIIAVKQIDTLHIIHSGFTFDMLEELKSRHPKLRVILTLFNDRAAYFEQAVKVSSLIDIYTSDNNSVIDHFKKEIGSNHDFRLIPNGINCVNEFNPGQYDSLAKRTKLGLKKEDLAVFYVGRLSEEKNPNIFLDVANEVIHNKSYAKNIKFFMIGDGTMRQDVEDQIAVIDSSRMQYLGYQSAVADYLSAADIFVLPSSIEGFPLSILEAMAMQVIVIASNVGGVPEVIDSGKDGFVVAPGSIEEIAATIKKLSGDSALRADIKKLSRVKIETLYSNVVLGRNYRKLYERK